MKKQFYYVFCQSRAHVFFVVIFTASSFSMSGEIYYSDKYQDDVYEYRHVTLPPKLAELLPKGKLLSEDEWRQLGSFLLKFFILSFDSSATIFGNSTSSDFNHTFMFSLFIDYFYLSSLFFDVTLIFHIFYSILTSRCAAVCWLGTFFHP